MTGLSSLSGLSGISGEFGGSPSTLLNGLRFWYEMDETSTGAAPVTRSDDSPNVLHLTDNGPAGKYMKSGAGVGGAGTAALTWGTAVATYLSHADDDLFSFGDADFTIAFWAYLVDMNDSKTFLSKFQLTGGNQAEYMMRLIGAGSVAGTVQFMMSPTGTFGAQKNVATPTGSIPPQSWFFVVCQYDAANNLMWIKLNNILANSAAETGGAYNGTAPFLINAWDQPVSNFNNMRICKVGCWGRFLTDAELTTLWNAGQGNTYPFSSSLPDVTKKLLVFEGDSLTVGNGSTGYGNDYPNHMLKDIYGATPWVNAIWFNVAENGDTAAEVLLDDAQVPPVNVACSKNIAVLWIGTNDLAASVAPATIEANINTWCTRRKLAGYQVVVLTVTPRQYVGDPPGLEADRLALNALILANYAAYADAMVDVGGNPLLANPLDATVYTDGLHMTNLGYSYVAAQVQPVVTGL